MSKQVVETLKVLGHFLNTNRSDLLLMVGLVGIGIYVGITFGVSMALLYVSSVFVFGSLVSSISDKKENNDKSKNNRYY